MASARMAFAMERSGVGERLIKNSRKTATGQLPCLPAHGTDDDQIGPMPRCGACINEKRGRKAEVWRELNVYKVLNFTTPDRRSHPAGPERETNDTPKGKLAAGRAGSILGRHGQRLDASAVGADPFARRDRLLVHRQAVDCSLEAGRRRKFAVADKSAAYFAGALGMRIVANKIHGILVAIELAVFRRTADFLLHRRQRLVRAGHVGCDATVGLRTGTRGGGGK